MKKLTLILLSIPCLSFGNPYFRLLNLNNPQTSLGAYINLSHPEQTLMGTSLAVVTHSPKDGCLLPTITCEDWTPFALDWAGSGGKIILGFGPSANLSNIVRGAASRAIRAMNGSLSNPYVTANNLANALEPGPSEFNIAFGPKLMISPSQNFKGYFYTFAGVAWNW